MRENGKKKVTMQADGKNYADYDWEAAVRSGELENKVTVSILDKASSSMV